MRTYDVRIENDLYTADHIFRIFPSTPFRKVAKEYRNRMHQDPFKFYVGDYSFLKTTTLLMTSFKEQHTSGVEATLE